MKTLTLFLKKKWFDMILSSERNKNIAKEVYLKNKRKLTTPTIKIVCFPAK